MRIQTRAPPPPPLPSLDVQGVRQCCGVEVPLLRAAAAVLGPSRGQGHVYRFVFCVVQRSDVSMTPTFAATALHIDNKRWTGVPFVMMAGKVRAVLWGTCCDVEDVL